MLRIRRKLPIDKMAFFGSLALVFGFTGTLSLLREISPNEPQTGISTINERVRTSSATSIKARTQTTQKEKDSSSAASPDAFTDSGMNIGAATVPIQKTTRPTPTSQPSTTTTNPQSTTSSTTVAPTPSSSSTQQNTTSSQPVDATKEETVGSDQNLLDKTTEPVTNTIKGLTE